MKKNIYVCCFSLLGMLLAFLSLLLSALYRTRNGVEARISFYFIIPLIIFGAFLGYREGLHWWRVIYVEKVYLNWKKAKFYHRNKWHGFSMLFIIAIILTITVLSVWK